MKKNHLQPELNLIPSSSLETICWHQEIFYEKAKLWLVKTRISNHPSGSLWIKLSHFLETDRRVCTSGIISIAQHLTVLASDKQEPQTIFPLSPGQCNDGTAVFSLQKDSYSSLPLQPIAKDQMTLVIELPGVM